MGTSYLLSLSCICNMRNLRNVILRFTDSFHIIFERLTMFWLFIDLLFMCIYFGSGLGLRLILGHVVIFLFQLGKFLVKTFLYRRLRCFISDTLVFVPEIRKITIHYKSWSFTHWGWICRLNGLVSWSVMIVAVSEQPFFKFLFVLGFEGLHVMLFTWLMDLHTLNLL